MIHMVMNTGNNTHSSDICGKLFNLQATRYTWLYIQETILIVLIYVVSY